ncbi:MAG: NADAR domain-containing protein [Pseudomonadota bacterium]
MRPSQYSLEKPTDFAKKLPYYCNEIRQVVSANQDLARCSAAYRHGHGIFGEPDYSTMFSITGAFQLLDLSQLGTGRAYFLNKTGRLLKKRSRHLLRGPRYLAAVDPGLSIPQKIEILIEDLYDALEHIRNVSVDSIDRPHLELAPIIDYAKNSVLTLTNAFLHNEKRGTADIFDEGYWDLRTKLIDFGMTLTVAYYRSLINTLRPTAIKELANLDITPILHVAASLNQEYREYTISSRDIVRPEASNPLIFLAFASVLRNRIRGVDLVVGMPSGGTEIAFLIWHIFSQRSKNTQCVLLPISFHSMYVQYGEKSKPELALPAYWDRHSLANCTKRILVVDDNSSSGTTLQAVADSIRVNVSPHVIVAVAEADIMRSQLDKNRLDKRTHYAHQSVFRYSVGVLPVSKRIWRKHDLKEVTESRDMSSHYATLASQALYAMVSRIKYEVFAEEARNPFARKVAEPEWENTNVCQSFKYTPLSNFHLIPIQWKGVMFPSVEHAYQMSKFYANVSKKLPSNVVKKLAAKFENLVPDLFEIFKSSSRKPSEIKRIANDLAKLGLVRADWDAVRVEIMIELLLKKFSHQKMKNYLIQTEPQYLVEGNDWEDTFWGACPERDKLRGRNVLGLILMNIRSKITSGEL